MSMPVITLTPPSKTPEIIKITREASFSSYLDGSEESFVLKLGGAGPHDDDDDRIHLAKNEKEIDVFDAAKYFNGGLNYSPKVCTKKEDPSDQMLAMKKQPPIAALSIRSDSSWNSRTALLRNVSRNQQLRKPNKKSFFATIGCNCTCADNNSVDIDDYIRESNSKQGDHKTNDHFNFKAGNQAAKMQQLQDHKRPSQRVLNNKLTMVTWGAIAPSPPEDLKIPSISSEMHDDSDSDASSDLFEIESLYKDNPFDSTCYAQSEASVEWSVVTASAADFSLLSDSDDLSTPCPKKPGVTSKTAQIPRIRPSILSGCKSHKAVSVAADAHARRPVTRFHDETKLSLSFDGKTRQNSFDARIISQPRSATAARLLYTY